MLCPKVLGSVISAWSASGDSDCMSTVTDEHWVGKNWPAFNVSKVQIWFSQASLLLVTSTFTIAICVTIWRSSIAVNNIWVVNSGLYGLTAMLHRGTAGSIPALVTNIACRTPRSSIPIFYSGSGSRCDIFFCAEASQRCVNQWSSLLPPLRLSHKLADH